MKKSTVYLLSTTPVNRKVYAKRLTSSPGNQKIVSETTYDPEEALHFDSEIEAKTAKSQIKSIHSYSIVPFQMVKSKLKEPISQKTTIY